MIKYLEDDEKLKEALGDIGHSERMHHELDEASKMMADLTESLNTFDGRREGKCATDSVFMGEEAEEKDETLKRRSGLRSSSSRLTVISTLSTSEPGQQTTSFFSFF